MSINVYGCTHTSIGELSCHNDIEEEAAEERRSNRNGIYPLKVCSEVVEENRMSTYYILTEKDGQQLYSSSKHFS